MARDTTGAGPVSKHSDGRDAQSDGRERGEKAA